MFKQARPSKRELVLVVDSDSSDLEQTISEIGRHGYKTIPASSVDEAIDRMKWLPIDVIVTETKMPGFEERDYLGRFRQIDPLVPILIVTDKKDFDGAIDIMNKGAFRYRIKNGSDAYLQKDIPDALRNLREKQGFLIQTTHNLLVQYKRMVDNDPQFGNLSEETKDAKKKDLAQALGNNLVHISDRVFMDKVARITVDCAEGIAHILDEKETLSDIQNYFLIKKTHQISDVCGLQEDYRRYGKTFNLPEPHFIFKPSEGIYHYIVTELFPASDNAKIFSILNGESVRIGKKDYYSPLICSIVEEILDTRSKWFEATKNETSENHEERAIADYKKNMVHAIQSLDRYVFTPDDDHSNGRKERFLGFIDHLIDGLSHTQIDVFGRVMDCSPSNSGIMTFRVNPSIEDILSAVDGVKSDERLYFEKSRIKQKIRFWDIPKKSGHVFEDFFHIIDSYETGMQEEEKLKKYNTYLTKIYGNEEPIKKALWSHFFIMGFYRNLRKMDLVMTKYAANNEMEHEHLKVPDEMYDSRKQGYIDKINHYCNQASKYILAYHQLITIDDIRTKSWNWGRSKVTAFFQGFSNEPRGALNPEYQQDSSGDSSRAMAYSIAQTLNEHYCGQSIDFPKIRSDRLRMAKEAHASSLKLI